MFNYLLNTRKGLSQGRVSRIYSISLGDLANQIYAFKNSRDNLIIDQVGNGLSGALYSTYISFLPKDDFSYDLPSYGDDRGNFVEVLKTPQTLSPCMFTSLQFSSSFIIATSSDMYDL